MRQLFLAGLFISQSLLLWSQKNENVFKTFPIDPELNRPYPISAIEQAPDQKSVAIVTYAGPLYIFDTEAMKISKKIDIDNYPAGARLEYSANGKYLLLQKKFITDHKLNKDKPSKVEIIDIASGKVKLSLNDVYFATFLASGDEIVSLINNDVEFWNLNSGQKTKKYTIEDAKSSVGVSKDGKIFAVAHKLRASDVDDIPSIRQNKKVIKSVIKFREGVSFYDVATGTRLKTANEVFDIIYEIKYSHDGERLLIYNCPNTKLQAQAGGQAGGRQGYISQVHVANAEVDRTLFGTQVPEPDYKISKDMKYMGVCSMETTHGFKPVPTVLLYDLNTGDTFKKFEVEQRAGEKSATTMTQFVFLPDGKNILLNYGGKLAVWNYTIQAE